MQNTVTFEYAIGETVKINASGVEGKVNGLSALRQSPNRVLVQYADKNGATFETWFNAMDLTQA